MKRRIWLVELGIYCELCPAFKLEFLKAAIKKNKAKLKARLNSFKKIRVIATVTGHICIRGQEFLLSFYESGTEGIKEKNFV
ncbi:MAG: hypothetical protein JEZ04_10600 [Spirochaetales bacterium]|nr:hypothetical protein [Spirochaetales bacterium]